MPRTHKRPADPDAEAIVPPSAIQTVIHLWRSHARITAWLRESTPALRDWGTACEHNQAASREDGWRRSCHRAVPAKGSQIVPMYRGLRVHRLSTGIAESCDKRAYLREE